MSFRKAVAANLVVQSIGPVCSFLTVFVIARLGGPSEQGEFAQMKAWSDFMFSVGCFGFPQGFIYTINKLGAAPGILARWSNFYGLAFVPVGILGGSIAVKLGLVAGIGATPYRVVAILAVAASLLVVQGLWRGIFLTHDPRIPFALFTIRPAVFLFITVLIGMLVHSRRFDYMILISTIATVLLSIRSMAPIMRKKEQGTFRDQPWRPIMSNGLHSFIQSLLQNAQPMIAYALVRSFGGVNREAGFLNVGLFLVTGLSVPITMVAPLLFARWTSTNDDRLMDRLYALTFPSLAIGAGLGLVLAGGAHFGVPIMFGKEYIAAVTSTEVMLLTLPLVCHIRVLAPALHARGRPAVNTVAGIVRVGSFVATAMLLAHVTGKPLLATGAGWAIAEVVASIWTLVSLKFLITQKTSAMSLEYR